MFKFFKNNDSKDYSNKNEELLTKTASLLIHAAKIDENYTDNEKKIIKKTLIKLGVKESIVDQIMLNAEINEEKSNQILDFTKEIKMLVMNLKLKLLKLFGPLFILTKKRTYTNLI